MEIPVDDVTNDQPTLRVLKAYYKINKVIGKGAFGIVYKAFELCSGRRVAVKQIKIDEQNKNLVLKEVEVLKKVEHPNIVQYFNFLKEDNYMFIIMEFLEGGTLKEYIKENQDNITEDISREIIKQIFNALSYLHYSCDVCHRDIKPENIMFSEKNNITSLKLLDFGLSSDSFESKLRLQNCGTLTYMAPEQISGVTYSKAVDVWSVGIILYMLLNKGKNVFYEKGDSNDTIIDKINNSEVKFDLDKCPVSPIARHLIYKLLDKNPSYRYSARLALNHPWITNNKTDKIPITLYDKLLLDESGAKLKMLFLISSFMSFYRKKFLEKKYYKYKLCKSEKHVNEQFRNEFRNMHHSDTTKFHFKLSPKKEKEKEKEKNNINIFNFEDYEKKVIKTSKLVEEKYTEERKKMFLIDNKDDDKDYIKFQKVRIKFEKFKKEKNREKNLKIDIAKEINNENIEENLNIDFEKEKNLFGNSPTRYASINNQYQLPYKSILKKNNINNNQSPINLRSLNEDPHNFKEQGKTPDINFQNKKYSKKLSSKLISFKLNLEPKREKSKYVMIPNVKNKLDKPIKLQSLKNNNISNFNQGKIDNILTNKDITNHNIFETINNKTKINKNIEKLKKYSSMEKIERNIRGTKILKISNSMEDKSNVESEKNEKKKLIYNSAKHKDEFKNNDNKLNIQIGNRHSAMTQGKILRSSLTSNKKSKTGRSSSIDSTKLIYPKKLFQNNNNYFLPPIRK